MGHVLVLGGARSGKTAFAEGLAMRPGKPAIYLATAQALDDEMDERVRAHQQQRGPRFDTVEEPLELGLALRRAAQTHQVILVDCLTLWITNLLMADRTVAEEVDALVETLQDIEAQVILVSNEVGMGIVPDNAMARMFRDLAGQAHQQLAEICAEAYLVVAGLPLALKQAAN